MAFTSLSSSSFLFLIGVTASACGGSVSSITGDDGGETSNGDAGTAVDPTTSSDCVTPVADYCRANPCPASTSDVMAFAAERCVDPHWPIQINRIARAQCRAFSSMTQGDQFVSLTYYFDNASGAITAIYTDDDTHPKSRCLGGPLGFAQPTGCRAGAIEMCSDLAADGGAGD